MYLDLLLFSVQLATAPSRNSLRPWESGVAAVIFGRQRPLPVFQPVPEWTYPVHMIVSFPETVKLPASGGKVSITAQPFKRLRGSPESRDEKDMRLRATHVKAWMNFTLSNLQASCAGLQLEGIGDDAMRVTTMEDVLFVC